MATAQDSKTLTSRPIIVSLNALISKLRGNKISSSDIAKVGLRVHDTIGPRAQDEYNLDHEVQKASNIVNKSTMKFY